MDHAELLVGIGEGGEDFSGYAEVGVVHVLALLGLWQREGEAAEVSGSGWHAETPPEKYESTDSRPGQEEEKDNASAQSAPGLVVCGKNSGVNPPLHRTNGKRT